MYKSFAFAALLTASQAVKISSNTETEVVLSSGTETLAAIEAEADIQQTTTTLVDAKVYCASRLDKPQCQYEVACLNKPTTQCKARVACYKKPTATCIVTAWDLDGITNKLSFREASDAYFFFYPSDMGKVYPWDIFDFVDTNRDYWITATELSAVPVTSINAKRKEFRRTQCIRQPTPECIVETFDLDGNTTGLTLQEASEAYFTFYGDDQGKVSFE